MTNDVDFQIEKRRYQRLDKTVVTWYKPLKKKSEHEFDETLGRLTKNIAGGGVLFETDELVPLKTELDLEIKLPSVPRVIKARGRVVRIEEIGDNRYDIGVYFLNIEDDDRDAILQFISKRSG